MKITRYNKKIKETSSDESPLLYSGELYDLEFNNIYDQTYTKDINRWFPDYWLAFQLLARPVEDINPGYVLTILDSGLPRKDRQSKHSSRAMDDVVNVGRAARRRENKVVALLEGDSINVHVKTPVPTTEIFTHKIVREPLPPISNMEKLESNLIKRQKIYMCRTDEASQVKLREIEDKLLQLYEKEAAGIPEDF
jgi:hypothetical protein